MILCPLQLPLVNALDTLVVGLYRVRESNANIVPELWKEVPLVTRVFEKPSWKYTIDSGALSDLDDVWDIQQWRKNDVEIAPMAEHEPLRADLLYVAHIKFANIVTSDLPLCPRLGNMVVKAQNEGIGRAGWQLAWPVQH